MGRRPSMTALTHDDSTAGGGALLAADDEFITVGDVAERLRIHPQTVRTWIARGDLRAIKIGRTVRIRKTAFQEMLERARILPQIDSTGPPDPGRRARVGR